MSCSCANISAVHAIEGPLPATKTFYFIESALSHKTNTRCVTQPPMNAVRTHTDVDPINLVMVMIYIFILGNLFGSNI